MKKKNHNNNSQIEKSSKLIYTYIYITTGLILKFITSFVNFNVTTWLIREMCMSLQEMGNITLKHIWKVSIKKKTNKKPCTIQLTKKHLKLLLKMSNDTIRNMSPLSNMCNVSLEKTCNVTFSKGVMTSRKTCKCYYQIVACNTFI